MSYVISSTLSRYIQKLLVPFLTAPEISTHLSQSYALNSEHLLASHFSKGADVMRAVNACLMQTPAFFEAREARNLFDERQFFCNADANERNPPRRYKLEQHVTLIESNLLDDGVIYLWLPVPRFVDGVQHVKLLYADPSELVKYYLPTAGQMYGIPLLIEPGKRMPELHLCFEVDQFESSQPYLENINSLGQMHPTDQVEAKSVDRWINTNFIDQAAFATTSELVNWLVDKMESDFRFEFSPRSNTPITSLVTNGVGDVRTFSQLLAAVLGKVGLVTHLHAAQRLMLSAGCSTLFYPGSAGYEHIYLEWYSPDRKEAGTIDLNYLERWSFVSTLANTPSKAVHAQLHELGTKARAYLRCKHYPVDLILSGQTPRSRMHSFSSGESYLVHPPVDLRLEATHLQ